MSTNDYSTTSCSKQYYDMFISGDQQTFDKRKKLIDGELKPAYAQASENDRLAGISLYSKKRDYYSMLTQNTQFNKMIHDLLFEKKVAENNARKAALARGASIEEADKAAENAGKSVQTRIDGMLFAHQAQINQAVAQSKTAFTQASDASTNAHSKYMSASINLDSALFSQNMLASDINKNTGFYNFLTQVEQRKEWLG